MEIVRLTDLSLLRAQRMHRRGRGLGRLAEVSLCKSLFKSVHCFVKRALPASPHLIRSTSHRTGPTTTILLPSSRYRRAYTVVQAGRRAYIRGRLSTRLANPSPPSWTATTSIRHRLGHRRRSFCLKDPGLSLPRCLLLDNRCVSDVGME